MILCVSKWFFFLSFSGKKKILLKKKKRGSDFVCKKITLLMLSGSAHRHTQNI